MATFYFGELGSREAAHRYIDDWRTAGGGVAQCLDRDQGSASHRTEMTVIRRSNGYRGKGVSEARRLKVLKAENRKLQY